MYKKLLNFDNKLRTSRKNLSKVLQTPENLLEIQKKKNVEGTRKLRENDMKINKTYGSHENEGKIFDNCEKY